jgi:hypothetical protein
VPASVPATSTSSAPEDDTPTSNLRGGPNDVFDLILDETADVFSQGATEQVNIETNPAGVSIPKAKAAGATGAQPYRAVYTSRVIEADFPFNELVPSWNVDLPEGTGFQTEIRLGRKAGGAWTPFYYFGVWGVAARPEQKTIKDDSGVVEVDTFRSQKVFDRIQYRFTLVTTVPDRSPAIRRVGLSYSNTLNDAALAAKVRKPVDPGPAPGWTRRLPVPWRSQSTEAEKIRHSICSPTSVAMVLQYYGVNEPTAKVAEASYDPEYRMYGNWIRAVQTAYSFGVAGYVERFGEWESVKRHIAAGHPLIASIKVSKGELRNAPYRTSGGHLIVIVGFDNNGNVHINDPAGKTMQAGVTTYAREDVQKIWLNRGGVAYVLTGPAKAR